MLALHQPTAQKFLFKNVYFHKTNDSANHRRLRELFDLVEVSPILPTVIHSISWDNDGRGEKERSGRIVKLLGKLPALKSVKMDLPTLISTWTPACGLLPSRVELIADKALSKRLVTQADVSAAFFNVVELSVPTQASAWFAARQGSSFPSCRRLYITAKHKDFLGTLLSFDTSPAPLLEFLCCQCDLEHGLWRHPSPFRSPQPNLQPLEKLFPSLKYLQWTDLSRTPYIPSLVLAKQLEVIVFIGGLRAWGLVDKLPAVATLSKPLANGQLAKLRLLILPEIYPRWSVWANDNSFRLVADHLRDVRGAGVTIAGEDGAVVSEETADTPAEYSTEAAEILCACTFKL